MNMTSKNTGGGNKQNNKLLVLSLVVSGISIVIVLVLLWYVFDRDDIKQSLQENPVRQVSMNEVQESNIPDDKSLRDTQRYQVQITNDDQGVGKVVQAVARHIFIPKGDVKVGVIENVEGLQTDFEGAFDYAKNGHYLLNYPNGIIIYDADMDRIVDIIRLFGGKPPIVTF